MARRVGSRRRRARAAAALQVGAGRGSRRRRRALARGRFESAPCGAAGGGAVRVRRWWSGSRPACLRAWSSSSARLRDGGRVHGARWPASGRRQLARAWAIAMFFFSLLWAVRPHAGGRRLQGAACRRLVRLCSTPVQGLAAACRRRTMRPRAARVRSTPKEDYERRSNDRKKARRRPNGQQSSIGCSWCDPAWENHKAGTTNARR